MIPTPHQNLLVLSRFDAMDFTADVPYVVISVTDPEKPPALLPASPHCLGVLRLQFHDIHKPQDGYVLMSSEQAMQIISFTEEWYEKAALFVVHCEGGISRSASIAAALAKWWFGENDFFFEEYIPNAYIYALVMETISDLADA
jgi:predicted protein tyrosine phosphatase